MTASLWLVLAWRSLHVDVASVRRCVRLLRFLSCPQAPRGAAAAVADECVPAAVADAAVMDAMVAVVQHTSLAARSVTLRLKQHDKGGAAASADPPHPAPVTAGGDAARLLARLHPRTFIEAVALEAEMRGADPEAIEELMSEAADVEALAAAVLGPSASLATSASAARLDSAALSLDTGETTPEAAVVKSSSRVSGVAQSAPLPVALPVTPVSGELQQGDMGALAGGGAGGASSFPLLRAGVQVDAVPRGGLAAAATSGDVRLELLVPPRPASLDSWTDPRATAVDFGHWRARTGDAAESTPSLRRGAFDTSSPSRIHLHTSRPGSNRISACAESTTPNVLRRQSSAGAAESIDAACSPVARYRPPLVSPADAAGRLGAGNAGAAAPVVSVRVAGSRSQPASQAGVCAGASASKAQVPPLALPASPGTTVPSHRPADAGHSCCCVQ